METIQWNRRAAPGFSIEIITNVILWQMLLLLLYKCCLIILCLFVYWCEDGLCVELFLINRFSLNVVPVSLGDDEDLMPVLLEEFPHLYLSEHTWHELWRRGIRQIENLTRAYEENKRKKSKAQVQVRTDIAPDIYSCCMLCHGEIRY